MKKEYHEPYTRVVKMMTCPLLTNSNAPGWSGQLGSRSTDDNWDEE